MSRRSIDLPIASVTLLEDRAHVVRRGAVRIEEADERVRVERVAPVIADKTLSVRAVEPAEGGLRPIDARVRRRAVIRMPGGGEGEPGALGVEREALEDQLRALDQRIDGQRARLDRMERQGHDLDQAAALTLVELAADVAWGEPPAEDWTARLDQAAARERELGRSIVAARRELAELERERERLALRVAALDRPDAHERADLEIDLQGAAGASAVIEVDYVVPGALWRPWHTARLDGGAEGAASSLEIATDGCVWQNTGEDWQDVELVLSTERASLGAEPPRLASDVLQAVRRGELVIETREQEVETAGLGGEAGGRARVAAEVPGIDDGGEALHLRPPGRATVPSDGRPHRIRLASFTTEARADLVAYPELASAVLLRTTQENRGAAPLLAGPVDLVRSSGLAGRTSILFVAPGERFELGWGPDADLRVARDAELLEEKKRLLSSRVDRETRVRVRLSNLGARPRTVTVTERVPVSEIDKVEVVVDPARTTDRARPDDSGFIRWTVDLAPHATKQLELVWGTGTRS